MGQTLKKDTPLHVINNMSKNTMLETLDIEVTEVGDDYLIGTMPVDHRTKQPAGLLHGGASCTLIESLGSIGSTLVVDFKTHNIVGIEINANHVRSATEGVITGVAKLVHGGRKIHIWQVDIHNNENKLICTGRLTVMVIPKK
ncbi:MAG: hotdog fold thioesterase [Crocinitomicaceae bacterium]|nr:hotdog fold thioesterase [Crocinitomicaceae bacterium]